MIDTTTLNKNQLAQLISRQQQRDSQNPLRTDTEPCAGNAATDGCPVHHQASLTDEQTNSRRNLQLLAEAEQCFQSLADFRQRRQRAVDYYRGRQWGDLVTEDGRQMTEDQYLRREGRIPLKQNMIRPPLRNLIGQYRSNATKPMVFARNRTDQRTAEMMSVALDAVLSQNNYASRDARQLEEFLISGCCIYRTSYSMDDNRQHALPKFRAVNPSRFFMRCGNDVCGDDVDLVGEVLDLSLDQLLATYAHTTTEGEYLRSLYPDADAATGHEWSVQAPTATLQGSDLLSPDQKGRCRVIEIWRKEGSWCLYCHDPLDGSYELRTLDSQAWITAENCRRNQSGLPAIALRQKYATRWHCYHLTPAAQTIYEGYSPYQHASHPFIFAFYPMVNGECWGLVEDLIDQQKMINRNMVMFDFMNSASAKGVLLVPEDCIPDDGSLEEIADEWTRYNGVIKIRTRTGAIIPQQISSNAINPGLSQMLQMQMNMMNDIGGVGNAAQGKAPAQGTPTSLYAMEHQNATINTLDYIDTFNHFVQQRDQRMIQLIQQYYTSSQYINLAGRDYSEEAKHYDPQAARDVDYMNSIVQSQDVPAFRSLMDNTLMQLLQNQQITLQMFLENCSLPYADRLLQQLKASKGNEQQHTNGDDPKNREQ